MKKRLLNLLVAFLFCGGSLLAQADGIPWVPQVQLFDNSGDPLNAGHVHTYISGTTTNQATYTDATLGTANANPVVLSASGRANIWLDETLSYRMDVVAGAHAVGESVLYSVDNITSQFSTNLFTIGSGAAIDIRLHYDGNAQDFHIGLDDSADDLVFGLGSVLGTTTAFAIDENQVTTFSQDPVIAGTTPRVTIGDAGAEDTSLVYDGATQDYYVGLQNTTSNLVIGLGSVVGTTGHLFLNSSQQVGIGAAPLSARFSIDGQADENQLIVQGNATQTANLVVFENSAGVDQFVVTNAGATTITGSLTANGAVTLGDAAADAVTVTGTITSNLIFTDNTYDIGASGATRPRALFLSGNATIGGTIAVTGAATLTDDLAVNGGDLTSSATTFNLLNATVTTGNLFGAGTTISIGAATGTTTIANATLAVNGDIDMADDNWIGLSSGAALIEFDDQATDEVNILNARVGIGTQTPTTTLLHLENNTAGTNSLYINAGAAHNQPVINIAAAAGRVMRIDKTAGGESVFYITRNNASAPAFVEFRNGDDSATLFSVDGSGNITTIRSIALSWPTDDGDAGEQLQTNGSGTLSWEAAGSKRIYKRDISQIIDPMPALNAILSTPVYNFRYLDKKPPGMERLRGTGDRANLYTGVMAEEAPWAMHHNDSMLDPISTFGYSALAIKALNSKILALEARIAALEALP